VQRGHDVAVVVALGELDRLPHERQRREVQHAVVAVLERDPRRLGVEQVDLLEGGALRHGRAMTAVERVEHGDVVPALDQLPGDDRADVAGSAGDEKAHGARS
jgi:hypothetical protein